MKAQLANIVNIITMLNNVKTAVKESILAKYSKYSFEIVILQYGVKYVFKVYKAKIFIWFDSHEQYILSYKISLFKR